MGEVREKRKLGLWIAAALFLLPAIIEVALRIATVTVSGSTRNTPEQIEHILREVPEVVAYLRGMSPVWDELERGQRPHLI